MILIVEDEENLARIYVRALTINGFEADYVRDGPDAIAWLSLRRADLLLVDLGLPGMHGCDLINHLHEMGIDVPAIGMSGYRDVYKDERLSCFVSLLDKPLKLDELIAAVRQHI
jgi:DNA-binding response OmpR family regulator